MAKGINLQNVSFSYPQGKKILKNISLKIKSGDFLGITGINGSGKSTLAHLLNGLIPHQIPGKLTGKILIDGISTSQENVPFFAKKVGMVFQNPDFSLFNLTVKEELLFGLKNLKLDNKEKRFKSALKTVSLTGFINRDPQTLSFGEKQKVCLASVLALDTDYLVLDEPTSMLDYKNSLEIYQILAKLNNQGKTIVTIDHNTDLLNQFTKKAVILDQGKIKIQGPANTVFKRSSMLKKLGIKPISL